MFHEMSGNSDRACSGTAASMRSGKGLVEIQVHNVESHVAGTHDTDERVHVCPVVVEKSATAVHKCRDFLDFSLEKPERVRVCHHYAGNCPVQKRLQVLHVYTPVRL